VSARASDSHQEHKFPSSGTFALVHGAWHGSWCWERLTPLLEELGHRVVVVDPPSEDQTATFRTDADVVCDDAGAAGVDDAVLVGTRSPGSRLG
jgi:pimeloyl-ACP methyl ester carboxylesterase